MNTEDSSKDGKYYTDTEIAGLLGISLGRLRNKLCARQSAAATYSTTRLSQSVMALSGST